MNPSDDSLPISALQHWLFCPRQCALIHVERLWAENRLTAEGRVFHQRPDEGAGESRGVRRILRGVEIASENLGVHGVADVVELHGRPPIPFPVEYKRGRPKSHRADEVQLCAQAICLEEMFDVSVPEGALFYGQNRRRKSVAFDTELRALTHKVTSEARAAIAEGVVPGAIHDARRCNACSLHDICRPERMQAPPRIATWLARGIASDAIPE